jgi:phospholipid transport system transporter-binding protein
MSYILPSTLTQQNAVAVELDGLRDLAQLEMVDCAALSDFDSSALAVLIAWQKKLRQGQRELTLVSPPSKLCVLAQVYGVAELLGTPAA